MCVCVCACVYMYYRLSENAYYNVVGFDVVLPDNQTMLISSFQYLEILCFIAADCCDADVTVDDSVSGHVKTLYNQLALPASPTKTKGQLSYIYMYMCIKLNES